MKEMEIIQTACELCPWGCGMDVFLKDGKIVKVRGTPDHPLNRGVLCPKGAAAPQFVYSENRLRTPLKKKDGDFVPISWDEALDLLSEKLQTIRERYGPKSLAVAIGMPILLGGQLGGQSPSTLLRCLRNPELFLCGIDLLPAKDHCLYSHPGKISGR